MKKKMTKKNVVVGVSAGAAIYKSCYLVRLLIKQKFQVKVVMTPHATSLISPILFESLTHNKVYVDLFEKPDDYGHQHIALAKWADIYVVAPLSLNTLSKIAHGICDNLLLTSIFALPCSVPLILAPAMNTEMWEHPVTRRNLTQLKTVKNITILGPRSGLLSCCDTGWGAMEEPEAIFETITSKI